jgi:hypothetical protein
MQNACIKKNKTETTRGMTMTYVKDMTYLVTAVTSYSRIARGKHVMVGYRLHENSL